MKPPNTRWICATRAMMAFAFSNREKAVRSIFFACAQKVFLAVKNVQRDNDTDQQGSSARLRFVTTPLHHVAELRPAGHFAPSSLSGAEKLIVQAHEAVLQFPGLLCSKRTPPSRISRSYTGPSSSTSEVILVDQLRQHHPQQHAYNRQTEGQRQRAAQAFGKPCAVFLNLRDIGGCRLRYSMLNTPA